jgi:TonB family protein
LTVKTTMKLQTQARLLILNLLAAATALADATTQPPEAIEQAKPEYSEALRLAGIGGQVVVQFGVDAAGAVEHVTVFKSDHPELEAPAVEAVKKWKFKPATRDGKPVDTPTIRVPLSFTLPPTPFRVVSSFEAALKLAGQEHKIVFVDFFTTWCEPCKMLDSDTWQDPSVIALLKEKTVALKVDAEKNVALASRYGVTAYPTLALIRPDGTLIDSLEGYRDAPTFTADFTGVMSGKTRLAEAREAVGKAGADLEKQAKARFEVGQELARKGEDAEALTEYLWCFDVGMKQSAAYSGVRVSFLLSAIATLGAQYPPALDALRARRDGDRSRLSDDPSAAAEFGGIDHYLDEDKVTLEAFDKLPAGSAARQALGHWVFDLLLSARRYDDAVASSPPGKFRAQFDMIRGEMPNESMREYLIDAAANELEALAGAGNLDDARDLLKALLDYDHSDGTLSAVRAHLGRAGQASLMEDLSPSPASAPVPAAGGPTPNPS